MPRMHLKMATKRRRIKAKRQRHLAKSKSKWKIK